MVIHTQQHATADEFLSVFDHFMGFELKVLSFYWHYQTVHCSEGSFVVNLCTSQQSNILYGSDFIIGYQVNKQRFSQISLSQLKKMNNKKMKKKYFEIYCLKGVRSFSGLYFLTFALSTERCAVSLRILSECRKI